MALNAPEGASTKSVRPIRSKSICEESVDPLTPQQATAPPAAIAHE